MIKIAESIVKGSHDVESMTCKPFAGGDICIRELSVTARGTLE